MFARNRQKHAEETANKHQRNVQETHLTTSRTIRAKVASFAEVTRKTTVQKELLVPRNLVLYKMPRLMPDQIPYLFAPY